jgi:O-antigen ligase
MREILPKIKFAVLCLVAFFIPGHIFFTPACIILYILLWVAEGNLLQKVNAWRKNKYALLFTGFYLLYVLWLLRTPDLPTGLLNLQIKLSIGIFPFLLASEGETSYGRQRVFMLAFISGCVVKGLICLGIAIWKYYALGKYEFTYSQLSWGLHPSYFNMYNDLALLFIFHLITSEKMNIKRKEKISLLVVAVFLLFLILLLQSKAGWLCTIFLLAAVLIKLFISKVYRKFAIIVFLGCIATATVTYYTMITQQRSRINSLQSLLSSGKMDSTSAESTQARYFIAKAAKQVIIQQPLIGYGTGQAWVKLQEQYEKDRYTGPLKKQLNAHDQYLQCAIDIGLIGLAYMVICLILPLFKAIKEKRFVYGVFICIFIINMFVESMLEQQSGTIFYGFFNSLLMFNFVI